MYYKGCGRLEEIKIGKVKLLYNPKNISISDAKAQLKAAQESAGADKFRKFIAVSPHQGEPWYEKLKGWKLKNTTKKSNRRKV